MSRPIHTCVATLKVCALAALTGLCGCASLWTNSDDEGLGSGSLLGGGSRSSSDDDSVFSWEDLTLENLTKSSKKLVGRGENKDEARRLYGEAFDLFQQAKAADPRRKAEIFALAAPKFAQAADRWPDSQLAMDGLFMAGESAFFADLYPQANLYYEKLVKAFPNNRYLDQVDKRRFAIARYWLETTRQDPE